MIARGIVLATFGMPFAGYVLTICAACDCAVRAILEGLVQAREGLAAAVGGPVMDTRGRRNREDHNHHEEYLPTT